MRLFTGITICALTFTLLPVGVFAQSSGTYDLSVDSTAVDTSATITVTWQTSGTPGASDWVGLYRVGDSDRSYRAFKYVNQNSPDLTFTLSTAGDYEFRYFLNNGYTKVATSPTVTVSDPAGGGSGGGNGSYNLSVDSTDIDTGQSVTVTWQTPGTPGSSDWVGLYRTGAADRSYSSFQYVRGNNTTFTISSAGDYEFRYFANNSYTLEATSPTVTVSNPSGGGSGGGSYAISVDSTAVNTNETITVTWQTPGTPGSSDWVGLYRSGDANTNYRSFQYVRGSSLNFSIATEGDYEFRYFANNSYSVEATSPTVTVTNPSGGGSGGGGGSTTYSLAADQTTYNIGDTARVTWTAPRFQFYDWIGLYPVGAANVSYLDFEYTDIFSNTETFTLNTPGAYEFRFFTKNSYDLVATSPTITVQGSTGTNPLCTYNIDNITNIPTRSGPIVAFGDSLTFGIGATTNQNYVDELEKRLGVTIVNEGVPGDTTRDGLARLQSDVLVRNPSTVIVFLGGNDEIRRFYDTLSQSAADQNLSNQLDNVAANLGYDWQSVPLMTEQETFNNLTTIVNRIQNNGAAVIVVGFNASIFNQNLNSQYQTVANNTNSLFVSDIYSGVFGRPLYMSDLVHPNNLGYDIFASRIVPALACTQ